MSVLSVISVQGWNTDDAAKVGVSDWERRSDGNHQELIAAPGVWFKLAKAREKLAILRKSDARGELKPQVL